MPKPFDLFRVLDGHDTPSSVEVRPGRALPIIERYWRKGDLVSVRREAVDEIERARPVLRGLFFGATKVAQGDPQSAERLPHYIAHLHTLAARAFQSEGAMREARQHLLKAVVLAPKTPEPQFFLVEIYEECGEYWAALAVLERLLADRPECCLRLFQLGASIHNRGAQAAAAACFEKVREHDDVGLLRELAELRLGSLKERTPSTETLEHLRQQSIDALARGDRENAFRGFMGVLSWFPENGSMWFGVGYLHHQMDRQTNEKIFSGAGIAPVFRETSPERQANLRRASQAYWLAVAAQPNLAEAHHQLANCYLELGLPALAHGPAREAAKLAPEEANILADLAAVLLAQNELAEAEAILRHVLLIDPHDVPALLSLAETLEKSGRQMEAEVYRHRFDRLFNKLEARKIDE